MICSEFVGWWGRKVIDRMVGVLGRCRLVWRSGISYRSQHKAHIG